MRGFNRVIIAGNLTGDPEVRYTVNKKAYARFRLAVSNRYRDANGEFQETTDYIDVVAWSQAETVGKYLKKGSPVLVEGSLRTRNYDAKDGSKRYVTEVNMSNMIMLGSREGVSGSGGSSSSGTASTSSSNMSTSEGFGSNISDVAFDSMQGFTNDDNAMPASGITDIPF